MRVRSRAAWTRDGDLRFKLPCPRVSPYVFSLQLGAGSWSGQQCTESVTRIGHQAPKTGLICFVKQNWAYGRVKQRVLRNDWRPSGKFTGRSETTQFPPAVRGPQATA